MIIIMDDPHDEKPLTEEQKDKLLKWYIDTQVSPSFREKVRVLPLTRMKIND